MLRTLRTVSLALASLAVGIFIGWQGGQAFTYDPLSEDEMLREWEHTDAAAVVRLAGEIRHATLESFVEQNGQ